MFYSSNFKKINSIQHCFFSRKNGVSKGIYESLNCGVGSKDGEENVEKNLDIVSNKFKIKRDNLVLMYQTHSDKVQVINNHNQKRVSCDAMLTNKNDIALAVLTADCVPILLYEKQKKIVGCIHAGWRGAINGIIEKTLMEIEKIGGHMADVSVSVGPCISQKNYEVKEDFYRKFIKNSKNNEYFFSKNSQNTFNFDLRKYVNKKLQNHGVLEIDNVIIDSYAQESEYFSHRRAKKLGQDDFGRCISVIKKINNNTN